MEDGVVFPSQALHGPSTTGQMQEATEKSGENESDTDSLDFLEENGSVVSGVEEPPLPKAVLEMDELQGTPAVQRSIAGDR